MNKSEFLEGLHDADFGRLFVECGWSNPTSRTPIPVALGESAYTFAEAAQQKGFRVLVCRTPHIPDASVRRALDAKIRRLYQDYLAIFVSTGEPFRQLWSVPVKSVDKRQLVTVEYDKDDQATFLLEKMNAVAFSFDEAPTIIDVANRVNAAFLVNTTDVTKKFYQVFRKQHDMFVKGILNVAGKDEREWYASVMLNRLMFCYFIQKKRFLNFDENYLGNKLHETQARKGKDKFYESFYRSFLKQLFSDGLDKPIAARSDYFLRKYGRIPYLNGGMFSLHQIERENKDIDISDTVFERLFAFFDEWHWHLDNRITASGRDINPDVLGYIFEQYINDRAQMGAYYTKEDITEYIGRNCILPWLWKKAVGGWDKRDERDRRDKRDERDGGISLPSLLSLSSLSTLPSLSPDRYLFPAMRKGIDFPLPPDIEKGVAVEPQSTLRARRANWNKPADEKYALPTEIWRETVARRQRCAEIREKFAKGEITDIHDFITYNLDIRTFVEDVIRTTDDHRLVLHFYKALREVTILDPTCGSGAFLFAALNILEPLYEACLDRMEDFHASNSRLFKDELIELGGSRCCATADNTPVGSCVSPVATRPPNRQYFIYKNIILRNLFGVDIMHEATEIARLRLFLKMVAVVDVDETDPNLGLDPLPDIDFNIRCGNTLVGYASEKEIEAGLINGDMFAYVALKEKIDTEMQKTSMAFDFFRREQLNLMGNRQQLVAAKEEIHKRLAAIRKLLDDHLYASSGSLKKKEKWLADTQPFHWYTEFYPIMHGRGGFDVIIGNPPYVVYSEVGCGYRIAGMKTQECQDLYAFTMERANEILSNHGTMGMIVPISIGSTDGFLSLRNLLMDNSSGLWVSSYSMRPGKLFEGVDKHISIAISSRISHGEKLFATKYHRWASEARENLFTSIEYCAISEEACFMRAWPKISTLIEESILLKLGRQKAISNYFASNSKYIVYHTRKLRYFVQFLDCAPIIYNADGSVRETSELKEICCKTAKERDEAIATFLSSLFFWYFISFSDCRNLNKREVYAFPHVLGDFFSEELAQKGKTLLKNLQKNSYFTEANYKQYGQLKMQTFQPRLSKPIIDEIDELLAKHYGFTEEELDFIINYDIKYRMGDELNAGE